MRAVGVDIHSKQYPGGAVRAQGTEGEAGGASLLHARPPRSLRALGSRP
jgi:hypothetical protein